MSLTNLKYFGYEPISAKEICDFVNLSNHMNPEKNGGHYHNYKKVNKVAKDIYQINHENDVIEIMISPELILHCTQNCEQQLRALCLESN